MFKAPKYRDFSLNNWITHMPPELIGEHLDISCATLDAIPRANYAIPRNRTPFAVQTSTNDHLHVVIAKRSMSRA
jgi:hypothetical protein